jgi:hypothetical protein
MPGNFFPPSSHSPLRILPNPHMPQRLTIVAIESIVKEFAPITSLSIPTHIRIIEGMRELLSNWRRDGMFLFAAMHIPALARDEIGLPLVYEYGNNLERKLGYALDGFVYCPHDPELKDNPVESVCYCRMPKYGLMLQAHMIAESSFGLPFPACLQTVVGGDVQKKMSEATGVNYVSDEELLGMVISNRPGLIV